MYTYNDSVKGKRHTYTNPPPDQPPNPTHAHTRTKQAMRPLRLGPQLLPGSGFQQCATLEDTRKFAALFSGSYYHPACSCRLGEVCLCVCFCCLGRSIGRVARGRHSAFPLTHSTTPKTQINPNRWSTLPSASWAASRVSASPTPPCCRTWARRGRWGAASCWGTGVRG